MASSKKTLDIDTLTFQTMYIKAQAGSQISSYMIPMIPGNDTVIKQLIFLSPQQALSVGNIYITPSTIPDIISTIGYLSRSQNTIIFAASSISDLIGVTISSTNAVTSIYARSTYETIYNSTYSTFASEYSIVQDQNISTLALYTSFVDLTAATSTMSSILVSSFTDLDYNIDVIYNQGPSVSTMSTYMTLYFSSLYEMIPIYSTQVCGSISSLSVQSVSSYDGYLILATDVITTAAGPGVSSLSTIMASTFSSFEYTLASYNTGPGISSISTMVVSTLANYSTLFSDNSGIPGICSLSTTINLQSLSNIQNLQQIAGVPGLCTMSTTLTTDLLNLSYTITAINTDTTLSTFSTAIYTEINVINTQLFTIGYVNTILQQESVKVSISTLSTSFGHDYTTMTSLSTYSTMLGPAYSTISTLFSLQAAYSTLYIVSTNQGSNISTLNFAIYTSYPTIACGPGVSSLSSMLGTTISSMSTTLSPSYQSLASTITTTTSSFTSTTVNLMATYSSISSIMWQNLTSPQFSTFYAKSITTSSITIQTLILSSIGIGLSTSTAYPLAVQGGMYVLPALPPPTRYVMTGIPGIPGIPSQTIYTSSNAQTGFTSDSANQFTGQGNAIAYNGSLWIAVGSNTSPGNCIKYTSNPAAAWSNAIYPTTGVPSTLNTVQWNGRYWLTGGSTGYTLRSSNGSNWSNASIDFKNISTLNGLAWNGAQDIWAGVGADSIPGVSNILYYTDSTETWHDGSNTFSDYGNAVTTNGFVWVAVGSGSNSMKYSYDGMLWLNTSGPSLSTGMAVAWNGDKFVAGGSNGNSSNMMYSFDGLSWSYANVPNVVAQATSVLWDGTLWNVGSLDGTHRISYDGIQWLNSGLVTPGPMYGQAYASNMIPTFQLSNFDIYSQETPVLLDSRNKMTIIQSSIFFNGGGFTIRNVPSTIPYTCIGINTTYPTVALDIGYGDARKNTGAYWISPSDARVKSNIVDADLVQCAKNVLDIPLRQYSFIDDFQQGSSSQYGFIAQEVKRVLPNAIRYSDEFGFSDFHSLDTDQIFKLEFGATKYLLTKVQQMEGQISTLEGDKIKALTITK